MSLILEKLREKTVTRMEKTVARVVEIPICLIAKNPSQPRTNFDGEALFELAESIEQHGIIQPISVRKIEHGYELIAGERRLRAAEMAGFERVPCIISDVEADKSAVLALVENLMRQNLGFFEEAEGIKRLMTLYGITQEQAAKMLAKKQSTIANKLRLLRYDDEERMRIVAYGLSERHARAILRLEDKEKRREVMEKVAAEFTNVADTERIVEDIIMEKNKKSTDIYINKRKSTPVIKDIRIFSNTIKHAVETMKNAGIEATSAERQTSEYIEYIIRISR